MGLDERLSGIQVPLFSLRSRDDFGIGDFGALEGLFDWMVEAKQRLLMLLPLLPTAPGDTSPYSTRSAFGLNPLFVDLAAVPEFVEAGGVGRLPSEDRTRLDEAHESPRIRYDLVFELKRRALRVAFDHFETCHFATRSDRAAKFARYREEQSAWLESFALFAAVSRDRNHLPWWEWPEALRTRQPKALAEEAARLSAEVRFQAYAQWLAETQWTEVRKKAHARGIALCGDEPFIVGQDSADAWANPCLLRRDFRLGAPPDDFSATGQDWGLPYFDFAAMEKEENAWLRARARKAASYYDVRRVDHAVGYFRQWLKEPGAGQGRFLPPHEPDQAALGERCFRLLSEGAGIIAEDLGVIPPFVRTTLTRLGIPGYRVLRWEKDAGEYRNPHAFPELSLVTTGTHDTETARAWWEALGEAGRESVGKAYPEFAEQPVCDEFTPGIHKALVAAAQNARSRICVVPWQDVFAENERVNLPGSAGDANWSYRVAWPSAELTSNVAAKQGATFLAELTKAAGR